jgi:hypothetical protein
MAQSSPISLVYPRLGGICDNDFGLKAGFWSQQPGEAMTFRTIVGWATVANYIEAGRLPFVSVVLNDYGTPVFGAPSVFPDFVGVFAKDLTPEQAQAECLRRSSATATPSPPSTAPVVPTPISPIALNRPLE